MVPSRSWWSVWALGILVGAGAGAGSVWLWDRRVRRVRMPRDLERWVRGRRFVLDLLAREGALDFACLHARLRPPPTPERLADWLASMIADGTIGARIDAEGRARFVSTEDRTTAPRVTLDVDRLDRLLDRRDGLHEESSHPIANDGS